MNDTETIILVEFHEGRPFNVITTDDRDYRKDYNFDYCKEQDTLYWENVGSGPGRGEPIAVSPCIGTTPVCYWVADGVEVTEHHYEGGGPLIRLNTMPEPYTLENLFDGSYEDGREFDSCNGDTTYCDICQDNLPTDSPCRHVGYYDGEWFGCGSIEVEADRHKDSFFYLLDKLHIAKKLRKAILTGDYTVMEHSAMLGSGEIEIRLRRQNYGRRLEDAIYKRGQFEAVIRASTKGMLWLFSLEPGVTITAEKLTLRWIGEYRERKRAGECFGLKSKCSRCGHRFMVGQERHELPDGHVLCGACMDTIMMKINEQEMETRHVGNTC